MPLGYKNLQIPFSGLIRQTINPDISIKDNKPKRERTVPWISNCIKWLNFLQKKNYPKNKHQKKDYLRGSDTTNSRKCSHSICNIGKIVGC